MIKPVKIVKSVYPPDNIHDLWIDLTERPAVIKMFKNDGWEGISDAATEQDIKEMQDDLIKAQKMLQSLELKLAKKANTNDVIAIGSLGKINGKSIEDGDVTIDLSPYLTTAKAETLYVPLSGYTPTEDNFTSALKKKLEGIEEGANKTIVDSALSSTSTNPVQNKVVYSAAEAINTELAKKATSADLSSHVNSASQHLPAGGTLGQMLVAKGDGTAEWASADLIDLLAYGVEWDTTVSNPNCTRIGNPLLHKSLPIQSGLRGCVVQDGYVNYYLSADDWSYMEDGVTPSVLDGSEGTVEVDTGMTFYGKSFSVGNKRRVYISTVQIDSSWSEIPRMFIGAYRATVDTTDSSSPKAVSVVNTTPNFRGGSNRAAADAYFATDPFRSNLGKPRTSLPRSTMRTYANNAGQALLCYEWYKWVLYWLPVIEYATFDLQKNFVAELTSEGYHQGGLGAGVTTINSTNWNKYMDSTYDPITPCGYANDLGNYTGTKSLTLPETTASDGSTIPAVTLTVARYRGFENIFGDIWTNLDGIILVNDTSTDNGSGTYLYKKVYGLLNAGRLWDVTAEGLAALNLDTISDEFEVIGKELNTDGYIGEFDLGNRAEIIPNVMNGGTTSRKCDYHYVGDKTNTALRTLLVGGVASDGGTAGVGCFYSGAGVGLSHSTIGFRTSCKYKGVKFKG